MAFSIPENEQKFIIKISMFKESQFNEIISVLNELELCIDSDDILQNIISKIKSIPKEESHELIDTIRKLTYTFNKSDLSIEKFIDKISLSIKTLEGELPKYDKEIFKKRIKKLLENDSLKTIIKSLDLLSEHENVLIGEPRIFSDIRPVFGINPSDPPIGFLIVHKLKIRYKGNNGINDIYFSMDTRDIELLRNQLNRADEKVKSLSSVIDDTKIPYIKVK